MNKKEFMEKIRTIKKPRVTGMIYSESDMIADVRVFDEGPVATAAFFRVDVIHYESGDKSYLGYQERYFREMKRYNEWIEEEMNRRQEESSQTESLDVDARLDVIANKLNEILTKPYMQHSALSARISMTAKKELVPVIDDIIENRDVSGLTVKELIQISQACGIEVDITFSKEK